MASLTIEFVVGAQTATVTKTFTDARAVVFLDDLIEHFGNIDDGSEGGRPMTRAEVAQRYLDKLLAGQIKWAQGLKHSRRKAEVTPSDDLEGNL